VKVSEDLQEGEFPLPRGEYGYFCPITFTQSSWLIPGTAENEVQVKERVYRLAGEAEKTIFEFDPTKYIWEGV
jgi:hypothetical protein